MCIRLQRKRGIRNKCLHYMVNVILSFSLQILHHINLAGRMQPFFKIDKFSFCFSSLVSEVLCRLLGVATVMTTGALISFEFWVDWIHKYLSAWKKGFIMLKNILLNIFESSKQNLCATPGKLTLPTLYHMENKWKKTRCILKMIF